MFFFGSPEDTAALYWKNSTEVTGPTLVDRPLDEMTEKELRVALTYARISYKMALQDGAGDDVVSVLLEEHDKAFQALAEVSERFRLRVKNNHCLPLTGHSAESVQKYKVLAGVAEAIEPTSTEEDTETEVEVNAATVAGEPLGESAN